MIRNAIEGENSYADLIKDTPQNWILYCVSICLLSLITFESAIHLPFDTHDRDYMSDSAASGIEHMLSADKAMPGRPFFELFLWAEYQLWKDNATLYHTAGVLLHITASIFLALILKQRNFALPISFTAGFLFSINTAQFRAVHWISAHCYPLSLLCCFTAMYCFYHWLRSNRWQYAALTYTSVMAGLLSHICAIAILPLLCLDARLFNPSRRTIWFLFLLGLSAISCVFFIKHYYALAPQVNQLTPTHEWSVAEPIIAFAFLLGRLIATMHWLVFSLYQVHVLEYALGVMAIVAALILLIRYRSATHLYGVLWLFGGLSPFLLMDVNHIQSIQAGPSRYLYFAGAGAAILLASGICRGAQFVSSRFSSQNTTAYSAILYTALLFSIAISSIHYHAQAKAVSLYSSGKNYLATGHGEKGLLHLKEALKINRVLIDCEDAYMRMFTPALRIEPHKARLALDEGLQHYPDNNFLYMGKLFLLLMGGADIEQENAIKSIGEIVKHNSASRGILTTWYDNLVDAALKENDWDEVAKISTQQLMIFPQDPKFMFNLFAAQHASGQPEAASSTLDALIEQTRTDSENSYLLYYTGHAYALLGDLTKAELYVEQALNINPSHSRALELRKTIDSKTESKP